MRKLMLFYIAGVLAVSLVYVCSAQNSEVVNLTEKIPEIKEKINKTIEEAEERAEKKIEEIKEKIEEEKIILEKIKNETQEFLERLRNLICSEIESFRKCELRIDCESNFERKGVKKIWKGCRIRPVYQALKAKQKIKGLLAVYSNLSDCPENCTCTGSVTKCEIEGGRIMTIVAGKSGNIIIQTKNVNASTSVVLIKNETGVFGNFSGKLKKMKYPDEVREKVLEKLEMRSCNCTYELLEDGDYETIVEREYKIFGIFPRKRIIIVKIDSETGEITYIKRPWWRFLAVKSKE